MKCMALLVLMGNKQRESVPRAIKRELSIKKNTEKGKRLEKNKNDKMVSSTSTWWIE